MKRKNNNKKGFTIVELVIVIAVIAILAAVLIPTFSNIIRKAHISSDTQLIRNLNTALVTDKVSNGDHNTMFDALEATKASGYDVGKINASATDNEILWDSKNDVFCYFNNDKSEIEYIPETTRTIANPKDEDYWVISKTINGKYSTYLYETALTSINNLTTGLDVGNETTITSISYVNETQPGKSVVIRTNSFGTTLTINAIADTVKHYGNAAIVNVEKIASASYHENGTVGRLIVEKGHAVAEANATIFCFIDAGSDTTATVEVKSGAVVYDNNGENNGQAAVVEAKDDCGAGHHDFGTQLVIDNKVYEVCKSCGYTLVHVVDEITGQDTLTVKVDSSNNIVNTPVETFNNNSESVNEDGTVKSDATPSIAAVDASKVNTSCDHEFGEPVVVEPTCYSTGSKTYTCTKCGASMSTTIAKVPHKFYDKPTDSDSLEPTYHEKCLYHELCHTDRGDVNVAKIGDIEYRTLRQAIAAVTDGTPTTITMIADDAIYGNDGYTIAAGKNITLDLNGYKICNYVTESKTSQLFKVVGSLTIEDSTDTKKDGTGFGVIYNDYDRTNENVQVGEWWSNPKNNYTTNVITNRGTVTVQSGKIQQTAKGSICYAIDSAANNYVIINGGLLTDTTGGSCVRVAAGYTGGSMAYFTMNDGKISAAGTAVWLQLPSNSGTVGFNFVLNGGTIESGSYAFYDTTQGQSFENCTYTITGGTVNGNVYSYGAANFSISGGTFNGNIYSVGDIDITGGTINGEVKTNYTVLNVWFGSGYVTSAVVGEDYILDVEEDLSGKVVSAQYYGGATAEYIDSSKITINDSIITIDKSALHKFSAGQFCIWISIADSE